MLEKLVKRLLPKKFLPILLASASMSSGLEAQADTQMTVTGPVITTGEYLASNPGEEMRWEYTVGNTSDPADINNMIDFKLSAGSNAKVLGLLKDYEGSGTINLTNTVDSSGFSGLLYPDYGIPQENHVTLYLITPADTPSAPGLATATARGIGNTIPFNSVPVNVPFLPAAVRVESATQQVNGQNEFRYKITNLGTPKATANIPVGMNNQPTEIYVPTGITATVDHNNSFISTPTGGLNLNQSALYVIRTPQEVGNPVNVEAILGDTPQYFGAIMPGPNLPRALQVTHNGNLQTLFYVQPGTEIIPENSPDLTPDSWVQDGGIFRMTYNANLVQYTSPQMGARGYTRLLVVSPHPIINNALLNEPLEQQVLAKRTESTVKYSPGVTVQYTDSKPILLDRR